MCRLQAITLGNLLVSEAFAYSSNGTSSSVAPRCPFTKVRGTGELHSCNWLRHFAYTCDKPSAHVFVELAAMDQEASVLELAGAVIGLSCCTLMQLVHHKDEPVLCPKMLVSLVLLEGSRATASCTPPHPADGPAALLVSCGCNEPSLLHWCRSLHSSRVVCKSDATSKEVGSHCRPTWLADRAALSDVKFSKVVAYITAVKFARPTPSLKSLGTRCAAGFHDDTQFMSFAFCGRATPQTCQGV